MTTVKLSDYILEQTISTSNVSDIEIERLFAECEVQLSLLEAYTKQAMIQESLRSIINGQVQKMANKASTTQVSTDFSQVATKLFKTAVAVVVKVGLDWYKTMEPLRAHNVGEKWDSVVETIKTQGVSAAKPQIQALRDTVVNEAPVFIQCFKTVTSSLGNVIKNKILGRQSSYLDEMVVNAYVTGSDPVTDFATIQKYADYLTNMTAGARALGTQISLKEAVDMTFDPQFRQQLEYLNKVCGEQDIQDMMQQQKQASNTSGNTNPSKMSAFANVMRRLLTSLEKMRDSVYPKIKKAISDLMSVVSYNGFNRNGVNTSYASGNTNGMNIQTYRMQPRRV